MNDNRAPSGEEVRIIRDGFQPLGLVLPVFWLLWNRLWLEAALVFAGLGMIAFAANAYLPEAFPAVTGLVNLGVGLITAFEGPARLVAALERQGHAVADVIIASSTREAEEVFAGKLSPPEWRTEMTSRNFKPVSQASLIPLTGV